METCEFTNALLPERWVLGQLDPKAAAELEDHLMICGACQEAVESARGLRRGLALVAAERASRPIVTARPGRRWLALAALVPLAAAAVLLVRQQGEASSLRNEVARLEAQSGDAARLATEAETARQAGARELELRQLAEQRSQELEQQLRESQASPAGLASPLVDLPTFLLAVVRDRPTGPDLRIDRSQMSRGFNLALDLPDPSYTSFRVELESQGKTLLSRKNLAATQLEALLLTLPADFLPTGESRVILFGQGPGHPEQELARFRIAVEP